MDEVAVDDPADGMSDIDWLSCAQCSLVVLVLIFRIVVRALEV